jgi:hypothetical protein
VALWPWCSAGKGAATGDHEPPAWRAPTRTWVAAPGKLADFALFDGNPARDISGIRKPHPEAALDVARKICFGQPG